MTRPPSTPPDGGFTLIEVSVAMIVLLVGALSLATGVALSARRLTGSQDQLLASERAAEAVETVFKARDNRVLTWAQIRNVRGLSGADGGVFLDGPQSVRDPGADGLVNTADDGAVQDIIKPGPDGLLGTDDDTHTPLYGFTREIEIRDVTATLRQVRVIVKYRNSNGPAQYVLLTYLSAYA
jgi:prepilin-type N-terminal cleavage/methylation domain-containing protein